jgi:hypothetical protein
MLQHGAPYGSIPAMVMRTGQIMPVSPDDAREDLNTGHVLDMTDWRMRIPAQPIVTPLITSPPSPITSAVAQTVTAVPPAPIQTAPVNVPPPAVPSERHHWHTVHRGGGGNAVIREIQRLHPKAGLRGAEDVELGEWNGRPIAKFEIAASPPPGGAQVAAGAMRRAADALRRSGLASLPPELVGGPLAALMRGGAVELHFQNGAVVRTVL